jgi:CDP-2,3-bis-(O-geranylgeranyl)-sn-glycerol synthase
MVKIIIQTFWLLLPAGFANMAPVLFKWVPFLNFPVDFNKKFGDKPFLGQNKTYRGLLCGILTSILTVYIQQLLYQHTKTISLINYSEINIYLLGFLLGFGALFGDLTKSFFKRRIDIVSGKFWPPFDQIDWVIGALIFMSFYILIPWKYILTSILIFGLLHPIMNLAGYYLGIKKNKF